MHTVTQILVVGGTHGNELTGVRTVEQWPQLLARMDNSQIEFTTLMANPEAVKQRVRFVEDDLNRQFSANALSETRTSLEAKRAQTLYQQFGQNSDTQPDLVIDIHNTTSNMGSTLILIDRNPFNQALARYIHHKLPTCNLLLEDDQNYSDHPYLCSLGKYGVMIEMGAQPQGVCRADIFADSMELFDSIVAFASLWNEQRLTDLPKASVYQFIENISFPLDNNDRVSAMIHPNLQDADFCSLGKGQPIFTKFDGNDLQWDSEETVYPHFINEAAYQGTHVAFATARKIDW
jgi:aspartoacylase